MPQSLYKFVAISDIHWGAMNSAVLYDHLQCFIEFLKEMKGQIDFVVICGDYFDYRIQLNSKTALLAVKWFDELINTCKETGVKKVRVIRGTKEHDNDQLEVFRPSYELNDGYCKIYNETISEQLFDNLTCLFCPDENLNLRDYHERYYGTIMKEADIGFFHGNFDIILPQIEYDRIQNHNLPNMIYEYEKFAKFIKGPMIAGHWHIKDTHESLYYIGSYDRWKFGEEEPKGFIYGEYNVDDSKYFIYRVTNPYATPYHTFYVSDININTPSQFGELSAEVLEYWKENQNAQIRILYIRNTDNEEALVNFNTFRSRLSNRERIKIEMKDLLKKEAKKKKKEKVAAEASQYKYIFSNDSKDIPTIIRKFILDTKSIDLSEETILKYISKYLER